MPQEIALAPGNASPSLRPRRSRPAAVAAPVPTPTALHPATGRPAAAPGSPPSRSQPSIRHPVWCRRRPSPAIWSMQIASQPSSDSAQATYQDLARAATARCSRGSRRPVNIVRAEVDGRTSLPGAHSQMAEPRRGPSILVPTSLQSGPGGSCFGISRLTRDRLTFENWPEAVRRTVPASRYCRPP